MSATTRLAVLGAALALVAISSSAALAQKKYDTGASDTEIKIGNIMPYSGPASAYGIIGRTEAAYFKKINDAGGINGRKINFISYDDAYSPPKAVEQARKLVESDEVLLIFNSLGTPSNSAIQKYMNSKKVPQLFVATGATKWNDPKDFPWTMGWQPNYQSETQIYAIVHPEEHAERQDRGALPERRLRQGLSEGPEGRSRPEGRQHDRRRRELRDFPADHR
ncbi:ABC-type branched-subunit amino acid transport system substrate-binding protein [Bradyrhizobium sp. JR6.1]